jgi:ornithine lipid ester-linked acyl 2-hydroxylase
VNDYWKRLQRAAFTGCERLMAKTSLCGDHRFFDSASFPWIALLESRCQPIRAELERVLEFQEDLPCFQDISPDQERITNDRRWKTFFFYAFGHRIAKNCESCPETVRLLRGIPGLRTAFFSILLPGKQIPLHRGPYNGLLRYHLALKVPAQEQTCGIIVGGEKAHWREGKSLVFDDTYMHKAWNLSNEVRVVLFVDFCRPLPFPVSWINKAYIFSLAATPFITTMVRRNRLWEGKLEQLYQARFEGGGDARPGSETKRA